MTGEFGGECKSETENGSILWLLQGCLPLSVSKLLSGPRHRIGDGMRSHLQTNHLVGARGGLGRVEP